MRELAIDISRFEPVLPSAPLIAARQLGFVAGGRTLIDRVDLSIQPGCRTLVMGANGAGKSVLLRLLHGILSPTGGQVTWQGGPITREARLRQAMVFQRPVMLRRSVLANLRFALKVQGVARDERLAREEEALSAARLTDLANRPARVLSGGEQQRLAMARALSLKPEVLFLDEPTASLDPGSTLIIEGLIDKARSEGVAIVMVTHDAGQARRLGDELIFLHGGRVAEAGPAARILSDPQSEPARAWLDGRIYV